MRNRHCEYISVLDHLLALRQADDRRYTEVAEERAKALKIKELADDKALNLARELQDAKTENERQVQAYKDAKANELREQIASERGLYITREEHDVQLKALSERITAGLTPLRDFMTAQIGDRRGVNRNQTLWLAIAGLAVVVILHFWGAP